MAELVKSDIFFFITAVAVILIAIVILVALYYIIKILRDVEDITENVREESEFILKDVAYVRKGIKKKIRNIISKSAPKKKKSNKKK